MPFFQKRKHFDFSLETAKTAEAKYFCNPTQNKIPVKEELPQQVVTVTEVKKVEEPVIVENQMVEEESTFSFDSIYAIPIDIESYEDQNQIYYSQSSPICDDLFSSFQISY